MYYGKMTKELNQLYEEYNEKWGIFPDFYEETEYGKNSYHKYVADIKTALKLGIELPDIFPSEDDEY